MDFAAGASFQVAGSDHVQNLLRVRGRLDVRQALGPGSRAHKPHEGKHTGHPKILRGKRLPVIFKTYIYLQMYYQVY